MRAWRQLFLQSRTHRKLVVMKQWQGSSVSAGIAASHFHDRIYEGLSSEPVLCVNIKLTPSYEEAISSLVQ